MPGWKGDYGDTPEGGFKGDYDSQYPDEYLKGRLSKAREGATDRRAPRSPWQRFHDNVVEGSLHNPFGGEGAARALIWLRDHTGLPLPGVDPNINMGNLNEIERKKIHDLDRRSEQDAPASSLQGKVLGGALDLGGNLLGSVDPTWLIAPGRNAAERILAQGGVNAGEDAASQGVELHRGVRDRYDPIQTAIAGAGGLLLQGAGEGYKKFDVGRRIRSGSSDPEFNSLERTVLGLEGGGSLAHPKTSPKGAKGPMQVMDATAHAPGLGVRPWDGKTEADRARVGRQYLAALNHRYGGDKEKVLAAYNGGYGRVDKLVKLHGENWLRHMPAESRKYVANGLGMGHLSAAKSEVDIPAGPASPSIERLFSNEAPHEGMSPEEQSVLDKAMADNPETANYSLMGQKTGEFDHLNEDQHIEKVNSIADQFEAGKKLSDLSPEDKRFADQHIDDIFDEQDFRKWNEVAGSHSSEHSNLVEFPKDHVPVDIYRRQVDSLENGYRMKTSEIPENVSVISEARNARREAAMEAYDREHKQGLEDRYWNGRRILDAVKGGNSPLSKGEALDTLQQWRDVEARMAGSNLPPLGHDTVKDTVKLWKEITARLGANPGSKGDGASKVLGKGSVATTPVNDLKPKRSFVQLIKDLLHDESGTLRGDPPEPPKGPDGEDPRDLTPEEKLNQALKEAIPIQSQKSRAWKAERAKRVQAMAQVRQHTSGINGFFSELSTLSGDFPKINFEGIAERFTPEEVDHLLDVIKNHPRLTFFDSLHGREGLVKIMNGELPTPGEQSLLEEVFPDVELEAIRNKKKMTAWDAAANLLGISRAIKASFDLSAPLRQGLGLIHRKEYWKAFLGMFHQAFSEKAYQAVQNEIFSRPSYKYMRRAGLSVTKQGHNLLEREEQFMSQWAEKIPVLGRFIRGSERAYTGFLNKLRADTFDSLMKEAAQAGVNIEKNPEVLRDFAKVINTATGRGELPDFLQKSSPLLSATFFSPRLMQSRFTMLNPLYYTRLSPIARKEAVKSLLAYSSTVLTIVSLAKLGGLGVETDPRSADFAKIKVGNTRYDFTGGFQPILRAGAQLITGQTKSTSNGKVDNVGSGPTIEGGVVTGWHKKDEGFGKKSRADVIESFLANKQAPIPAFIDHLLHEQGSDFKPLSLTTELRGLFVPMILDSTYEAIADRQGQGLPVFAAEMFGGNTQTYAPNPPKKRGKKSDGFTGDYGKSPSTKEFQGDYGPSVKSGDTGLQGDYS